MKKIISLFLALVFAYSLQAQEKSSYTVKNGDTLYSISKSLDVTIAELKQWNQITGNEIELGQELVYYKTGTENTEAEESSSPLINQSSGSKNVFYTVKSGDTLYEIALDHDMTVEQLQSLNNLTSTNISIGQQLAVKKQATNAAPSVTRFAEESSPQGVFTIYEVKKGETASSLMNKFKMTEKEFQLLNSELQPDLLAVGQEVTVLLPPSRNYKNPYLQKADLQDLGSVNVIRYSDDEVGGTTTNGELYDPDALTAAHSNIALGSIIFIENPKTGDGVYVRINDRMTSRGLKLSRHAFSILRLGEMAQPEVTIYTEVNE